MVDGTSGRRILIGGSECGGMYGREQRQRNAAYKRLIRSRRWALLRRAYITAHPMCEECLKRGIWDSVAREVHHRRPISTGRSVEEMERLAFDVGNLESVCPECHRRLHEALDVAAGKRRRRPVSEETRGFLERDFGIL